MKVFVLAAIFLTTTHLSAQKKLQKVKHYSGMGMKCTSDGGVSVYVGSRGELSEISQTSYKLNLYSKTFDPTKKLISGLRWKDTFFGHRDQTFSHAFSDPFGFKYKFEIDQYFLLKNFKKAKATLTRSHPSEYVDVNETYDMVCATRISTSTTSVASPTPNNFSKLAKLDRSAILGEVYSSEYINLTRYSETKKIDESELGRLVAYSNQLQSKSEERLSVAQVKATKNALKRYKKVLTGLKKEFETEITSEWEGDKEELEDYLDNMGWYVDAEIITIKETGEPVGVFAEYYLSVVDGYTAEARAISFDLQGNELESILDDDPS